MQGLTGVCKVICSNDVYELRSYLARQGFDLELEFLPHILEIEEPFLSGQPLCTSYCSFRETTA